MRVNYDEHQSGYSLCIERSGERRVTGIEAGEAGRGQLMERLMSYGKISVFIPS